MLRSLNFLKKSRPSGSVTGRYFGLEGFCLHGAAFSNTPENAPLMEALLDGDGEIISYSRANLPCDREGVPAQSGFSFPVPMAWLHHAEDEIAFSFRILDHGVDFPKQQRTLSRHKLADLALGPPPLNAIAQDAAAASWGSPEWKSLLSLNLKSLRRKLRKSPETSEWNFPWGLINAPNLETVPPQIEDIYLKDGYRFEPTGPVPRIIDGGGNLGLSALWFRRAYPDADLTVYEADPHLAKLIQSNLAQAGVTDVRIEPLALWISDGPLSFDGEGDNRGHLSSDGARTVDALDIVKAVGPGVDLLKLDIEGAEFACLDHLMQSGAIDGVRHLVAELHLNQSNLDQTLLVLAGLRSHGFSLAFDSHIAESLGPESSASPFTYVGKGKTFVQLFAWRQK